MNYWLFTEGLAVENGLNGDALVTFGLHPRASTSPAVDIIFDVIVDNGLEACFKMSSGIKNRKCIDSGLDQEVNIDSNFINEIEL